MTKTIECLDCGEEIIIPNADEPTLYECPECKKNIKNYKKI